MIGGKDDRHLRETDFFLRETDFLQKLSALKVRIAVSVDRLWG